MQGPGKNTDSFIFHILVSIKENQRLTVAPTGRLIYSNFITLCVKLITILIRVIHRLYSLRYFVIGAVRRKRGAINDWFRSNVSLPPAKPQIVNVVLAATELQYPQSRRGGGPISKITLQY